MTRFYLFAVIALLLILGLLTYQILKPFLTPIAWAIVFSIIFYPVYVFNLTEDELNQTIIDNISKLGKEMVGRITKGATNVVTISLDFIFMVFSIFFFLRDGPDFLSKTRDYMPFSEIQKDRLVKQVRDIIISTIYGGVAVSIIQGMIAGLAFFFLGISTPVVWGLATSIASFVPILRAPAIWVPAT